LILVSLPPLYLSLSNWIVSSILIYQENETIKSIPQRRRRKEKRTEYSHKDFDKVWKINAKDLQNLVKEGEEASNDTNPDAMS